MLGGIYFALLVPDEPNLKHSRWDSCSCPGAGARGDVPGVGARARRMAVMVSKRVQMLVTVLCMTRASQQPQHLLRHLGRNLGPRLSSSR